MEGHDHCTVAWDCIPLEMLQSDCGQHSKVHLILYEGRDMIQFEFLKAHSGCFMENN